MAAIMATQITTRPPTTPPMIGAIGVFALDAGTWIGGVEGVGEDEDEDKDEDEDEDESPELVDAGTFCSFVMVCMLMDEGSSLLGPLV